MEPFAFLTDFELSLKRAGVTLTDQQVVEICTGWGFLAPLFGRLRRVIRLHPAGQEPVHLG